MEYLISINMIVVYVQFFISNRKQTTVYLHELHDHPLYVGVTQTKSQLLVINITLTVNDLIQLQ